MILFGTSHDGYGPIVFSAAVACQLGGLIDPQFVWGFFRMVGAEMQCYCRSRIFWNFRLVRKNKGVTHDVFCAAWANLAIIQG